MMQGQIDQIFWLVGAAVGAFVLLLPDAAVYVLSYGGRVGPKPSHRAVTMVRICAGLMLAGALAELLF
jgi:hypothetical protein